jgi:AraC family transcriptional regulator of adaptative response / DNA-3-methyladenine glycosylase II
MSENGERAIRSRAILAPMQASNMIDRQVAYRALKSRDPRFDGVFFVGVTSTGIYCRPICRVKTPLLKNCRFFPSAEAAEKESFRPCLRCRPELAPGCAPMDQAPRIATLFAQRIDESLADSDAGLEAIAAQFKMSSRQLRRIVQQELGVSPMQLISTRRLLLAKQLLADTGLPVIDIAFASGFASLRRFNDAFRTQYRMPPTRLRQHVAQAKLRSAIGGTSTLQLSYRPPYDWEAILKFLAARMTRGVEHVTAESYSRTVRVGRCGGWIKVTHAPEKRCLSVEFAHALSPVLPALLGRLRNLFDLASRPDLIAAHLRKDERLRERVRKNPGLRVPGAFDAFEMAVRAILGQQVTVAAATTLSGRLAAAFGEKIETPFPELTLLPPLPDRLAIAEPGDIARLGIVGARAAAIIALARAVHTGELKLDPGLGPESERAQLLTLPGIGPWTASYIAMRVSRWPDAFPKEDIAVRTSLGGVSARRAEELSHPWRPWRSYAVMHLWHNEKC